MTTPEQIPLIKHVLEREKWLLSERLGHDCGLYHPELLKTVCQWVIAHGEEMRKQNKGN